MKKNYNAPTEVVINLGMEENVLLGVSGDTEADSNITLNPTDPDGGNNSSRTNLWNEEW